MMTKKLAKYVVMLDGVALDDWFTCMMRGPRASSVVTARAVGTDDDVPPQPHLVSTGAGALSPKVRMAMLAYGSFATPKTGGGAQHPSGLAPRASWEAVPVGRSEKRPSLGADVPGRAGLARGAGAVPLTFAGSSVRVVCCVQGTVFAH